jgi:hypothetical protein
MWPGTIKHDLENIWDYAKSTGQMVLDRNNMTDGIIQLRSAEHAGFDRIN